MGEGRSWKLKIYHQTHFFWYRYVYYIYIATPFHKLVSSKTAYLFSLAMLHPPLSFKNILEARFVKVPRTYRLGNRFSKIGQADYLLIPDLLEEWCKEANFECEATPRHALKLVGSVNLYSDMIGLVHLWIVQLFLWIMVIGSYIRKLMFMESSEWLYYLRLPDDGAKLRN